MQYRILLRSPRIASSSIPSHNCILTGSQGSRVAHGRVALVVSGSVSRDVQRGLHGVRGCRAAQVGVKGRVKGRN